MKAREKRRRRKERRARQRARWKLAFERAIEGTEETLPGFDFQKWLNVRPLVFADKPEEVF